jgi:hypothetical protein
MKYHLISAVLILVAMILVFSGLSTAGTPLGALLVIAACACEFTFWRRFFHRPRGTAAQQ